MSESRRRQERRFLNRKVKEILDAPVDEPIFDQPSDDINDDEIGALINDCYNVDYDDDDIGNDFCYNTESPISSDSSWLSDSDYDDVSPVKDSVAVQDSVENELATWAAQSGCSREVLNQLLAILRNNGMNELPGDSRTLLQTPRFAATEQLFGGTFCYLGVAQGLNKCIKAYEDLFDKEIDLALVVNIDGLPLSKSSKSQLWPILGSVNDSDSVFLIAAFHGTSKPDSPHGFLERFLNEIQVLQTSGFQFNEKMFSFTLKAVICDAPARSYLKCITGHTGYSSCERCTITGQYISNRVVFLGDGSEVKRTDTGIQNFAFKSHQKCLSPFVSINFQCVTKFPLDYMHLVLLGVMKRMLQFTTKGPLTCRLSANHNLQISNRLVELSNALPSEFSRRPRSLQDLAYWKATEFRQFLLYLGTIVLKGMISKEMYEHFLALHIAISILLNDSDNFRSQMLPYCKELLHWFVVKSKDIYGHIFVSYNVHSLIHLSDDNETFKSSLNSLGAFKFEKHMQVLKKKIRGSMNPVTQLVKRDSELFTSVVRKRKDRPLVSTNLKDSCFFLNSGKFCFVNGVENHGVLSVTVVYRRSLKNIYETPVKSHVINTWFVEKVTGTQQVISRRDLSRKVVCLPFRAGFVLFPLLHEFDKTKY